MTGYDADLAANRLCRKANGGEDPAATPVEPQMWLVEQRPFVGSILKLALVKVAIVLEPGHAQPLHSRAID